MIIMTEIEQEYVLIWDYTNLYMFKVEELDFYFDIKDTYAQVNLEKHECKYCQCKRWSDFVFYSQFNHPKGRWETGELRQGHYIKAIYILEGEIYKRKIEQQNKLVD